MEKQVRVRFAPSPTGGLHLGGVRTVLFNYLFARHNKGTFVLRIEDTDQNRFVEGAEEYIVQCLQWCGLEPDESVEKGGPYAPYRQSERKHLYRQYAEQLIKDGYAYYAFDTSEELEKMRQDFKTEENPNPQYDRVNRMKMRNSLTLSKEETEALLTNGTPYVIRIKIPENQVITFTDMIRGDISFDTNLVDDKVLLKADGMPTYHLAVVVDDYLMKISHAFRGEEWLPSAPVHLLLWDYLGWKNDMPEWAHLPLILKPDGNGKLSKRDGDRLGFPVYAMDWKDPKTGEVTKGFKERGFLPEAFVNLLAVLGWNDGTEQEIYSMQELIERFDIHKVHKGGAKFNYDKAKWFNNQYIQQSSTGELLPLVQNFFAEQQITADAATLAVVIPAIKDRCSLLSDFVEQGAYFFTIPELKEKAAIQDKWNAGKTGFFETLITSLEACEDFTEAPLEALFNDLVAAQGIKKGEVMLPLRIMLVGGKFGPAVFLIAQIIGKGATIARIKGALAQLTL